VTVSGRTASPHDGPPPGWRQRRLRQHGSWSPPLATPPSVLVFAGIISVQLGAGLAGRMFSELGPAGVTGLRLWWAAAIMAVLGGRAVARVVRGAITDRAWRDIAIAVAFGLVLGVMNFSIYQSFARIPLGVAVTIEFLGPLAVAVASSRRLLDVVWVILAGTGVLLLTRGGVTMAHGGGSHAGGLAGLSTQATGIGFGLIAASGWAAYILLSRATGRRFSGSSGLVIAMVVAAVLVTGPSVAEAGTALLRPAAIAEGLAIGLLSSVIPYRVELEALRRVPAGTFGIWMSLEPAVAALIGLLLLGEALIARQWLAIGLVVVACAGASRSSAPSGSAASGRPPPGRPQSSEQAAEGAADPDRQPVPPPPGG
jgi:inner membrane transporter RhtA